MNLGTRATTGARTAARLAVLLIGVSPAHPEVALTARRAGHMLVLNQVFLDGAGPFRMMVDTGNASSLIRPDIARRLGLRPAYAVEQATLTGVRRVPTALVGELRVGECSERSVEMMIGEVRLPGLDGVLGQSWLARHDYLLDYRHNRLVLDGAPPEGIRVALRTADGCPSVLAEIDGRPAEVALDSGAQVLVLFEKPATADIVLLTNAGSGRGRTGVARIRFERGRERPVAAAWVRMPWPGPPLLPLSAFPAVHVSNHGGFVVFAP